MRRSRPLVVLAGLAVAGIVLLSWTQTWFTAHLDATSATASTVTADGSVVPYSALAIAMLALSIALTIAGRVLRVVLAVVEVLLGIAVVVTGIGRLTDPVVAAQSAISGVTGVQDVPAIRSIVRSIDVTPWPYVGIAGGVLAVALGLLVLVVQRSWPGPSRRYGGTGRVPVADAPRDAIVDWDDLSAGVDPTAAGTSTAGVDGVAAADGTAEDRTVGSGERRTEDDAPDHEEHREQH
ncbi:Trp biosynthesis-associated membrane protein [Curtobacterium sp. MCBD17_035]|uniref:Trp biosynthesis-associated membrane protein n=1 Tax=Curtobacterium sp. MCBD17_035 TaxID=2175673 RepID=UPI000DA864DE|nr:Trp biosynthesis-associated membrane protein [Curtobacterium sp. MCBD17_035]WIB66122.1 Trp biosynthesis-associated membrane protein [Curtobacterium sp. MCBD17_035]